MKNENATEDKPLEFQDLLSEYIARIEKAEERRFHGEPIKGIITSEDLRIEPDPLTHGKVERHQIGWRVYQHTMFYTVIVRPGTEVPKHHHDEDVFRYCTKGSFEIDGRTIKEGMWVAVTAGTSYSIHTDEGYHAFVGYRMACGPIH